MTDNSKDFRDTASRLEALERYGIMDSGREQSYDDLTYLAAYICETPIALITLLDAERQWFKSRYGLEVDETPIEQAFCKHTILGDGIFVVPDALTDDRFKANPLVTSEPHIRYYAGVPLVTPLGEILGTMCVIDREPRNLSDAQLCALQALSRQVVYLLELRHASMMSQKAEKEKGLIINELKQVQCILPICTYCNKVRDDKDFWHRVDHYFASHANARFSHGICPDCYPVVMKKVNDQHESP